MEVTSTVNRHCERQRSNPDHAWQRTVLFLDCFVALLLAMTAATPLPAYLVTAAALVTDCLAAHAAKAFSGSDRKTSDAKYLLRKIMEMNAEFNKRELWVKVRGRFQSAGVFDEALKVLEDNGYICIETIPTEGRPLTKILVNPEVNGP